VVKKGHVQTPRNMRIRTGNKTTGYTPIIAFHVLESGEVVNARVTRSSGIANEDALALRWIQALRYNNRNGCGTIEEEAVVIIDYF
jgi:TonB family protein